LRTDELGLIRTVTTPAPSPHLRLLSELRRLFKAASTGISTWRQLRQASSWSTTRGTIWQTQASPVEGVAHIKPWMAELTYSYSVDGEYYSGVLQIEALTRHSAEHLFDGWKGRTVVVRYSPSEPKISTLLKSDQPAGQLGN